MDRSEFETLLPKYPPKAPLAKDLETDPYTCAKGKNPSLDKIRRLCIKKYHCQHLVNTERLEKGDEKFYKS